MGKIVVVVICCCFFTVFPLPTFCCYGEGGGVGMFMVLWFAQNWGVARVLAKHAQVKRFRFGF